MRVLVSDHHPHLGAVREESTCKKKKNCIFLSKTLLDHLNLVRQSLLLVILRGVGERTVLVDR
jgi:hypothetical protein